MTIIKKKDIQEEVGKFEGFVRDFKYEILISYDCAGMHKPYREELLSFLNATYGTEYKNESLYQLKEKLNKEAINVLRGRIEKLFDETVLNEGIQHNNITTVQIIYPSSGGFNYIKMVKQP